MRRILHAFLLALLGFTIVSAAAQTPFSVVPFVGCKSDGQVGPLPAPSHANIAVQVDDAASQRLSFYKAQYGPGILGPRGWNCSGSYGSSGDSLIVTPTSITGESSAKITGPAIEMIESSGGTSGRFFVAQIAARVFPAGKEFVRHVIAEGTLPASNFPSGPFATDILTYRGDRTVEYQTPPNSEGLGTQRRMGQDGDAVRGVAILQNPDSDTDLLLVGARMPANLTDLVPPIIQQFELGN